MAKRKSRKKRTGAGQTKKQWVVPREVALGIPWPEPPGDLESAVQLVAQHAARPFALAEMVAEIQQHVRLRNPKPRDHIRSLLDEQPGLARAPAQEIYVPTRLLFGQAALLVAPTAPEIAEGILVPGHRFYPFMSDAVAPFQVQMRGEDGAVVPLKKLVWPFEKVLIYHSLMRPPEMLQLCQPVGEELPPSSTAPVELEVFDLRAFYQACGFAAGDLILARVLDYETGSFAIAYADAQTRLLLQKEMRERDEQLEDCLLELMAALGPEPPLSLLRDAYAHLYLDGVDLSKPASAFGPFLNQSKNLGLTDYHMQPCLVPREVDPVEYYGPVPVRAYDGRCETLEDILVKGDLSFGLPFVRAAILDELDRESDDREAVIGRLLEGRLVPQWNREDWAFFRAEFGRLWEETQAQHRELSPNASVRALRQRLLARCDDHLAFLRELDRIGFLPEELPMGEMTALATIDSMYHQLLQFLEQAPGAAELQQLDAQLSVMEEHEKGLREQLEAILEGDEEWDEDEEEEEWDEDEEEKEWDEDEEEEWEEEWEFPAPVTAYVFKVSFKYARRVWRKIELAGPQTLHQLHIAIQNAIDWDMDHLYAFFMSNRPWDQNTEIISPYDEEADAPSAAHVQLSDLGLRPGQKFLYLFDFGDEHQFEVEVVEIRHHAPAGEYPRLLESKGKAPEQYR